MPLQDLQILVWLCVTLTFDLLTPKVDRFVPLPHRPLVPVCREIGSLICKVSCSQDCSGLVNGLVESIKGRGLKR